MTKEIALIYDGSLSPRESISLRTLSYTLPHFQRAIDKTVYFELNGELRKYTSLQKENLHYADLYLTNFEHGSIHLPFVSDLLKGVPDLFKNFLSAPYNEAKQDLLRPRLGITEELDIIKGNAALDNLERKTQEDAIQDPLRINQKFAQAAILKDLDTMLSVVRADPEAVMGIQADTPTGFADFKFDNNTATKFSRICTQKRLSDPLIYIGKIRGLEEHARTARIRYSAKFISSTTNQEIKILIRDYEDAIKIGKYNLIDDEVIFWGAPIATYNAFDPVRGDVLFISILDEI